LIAYLANSIPDGQFNYFSLVDQHFGSEFNLIDKWWRYSNGVLGV
jgi:hypothetical protein